MRRWGKVTVVLVALALLWAGFAYNVARPTSDADYRRTVVQVAASAHDATRTGWFAGRLVLAGRAFPPFATAAFDDASRTLAGAQKQFTDEAPPDDRSRRLRDELAPLLQAATRHLNDAARAPDDAALRAAVDALGPLADRLDAFLEAHR